MLPVCREDHETLGRDDPRFSEIAEADFKILAAQRHGVRSKDGTCKYQCPWLESLAGFCERCRQPLDGP